MFFESRWFNIIQPHSIVVVPFVFFLFFVVFNFVPVLVVSAGISVFFFLDSELFFFDFFELSVEEKIDHNIPFLVLGQGSSKDEDFSGEEPHNHGDRFGASVVAGNGNIDELKRRVGVAKSDAGDVDVGSFNDGLSVHSGVNNEQELGFLELLGVLISQGTGGPSGRGIGGSTSVFGVFNDSSLSIRSGTDANNFFRLAGGDDGSGSELDLLVSVFNVDDVDTFVVLVINISLHVVVKVKGTDVSMTGKQFKVVFLLSGEIGLVNHLFSVQFLVFYGLLNLN